MGRFRFLLVFRPQTREPLNPQDLSDTTPPSPYEGGICVVYFSLMGNRSQLDSIC